MGGRYELEKIQKDFFPSAVINRGSLQLSKNEDYALLLLMLIPEEE
jgi:hypothetical protein